MGNKLEHVKLVSNIMVSIVLLIIYAHFFGRFSIQRYLARDVMIIEQEERGVSLPQPAITIFPENPKLWKRGQKVPRNCTGKGDTFIKCIEQNTYSIKDILNQSFVSNDAFRVQSFYANNYNEMIHSLELDDGMITHDPRTSHTVKFNNHISYKVFIMDPRIQIFRDSPETFPRSKINIAANTIKARKIYLKPIRHEKLNLPKSPCEPSTDYNFGKCVDGSLMRKAGCQVPWSRVIMNSTSLPLCDNEAMLETYNELCWETVALGKEELSEFTKCLLPCTFMEYKQSGDPETQVRNNVSELCPLFATGNILVRKEVEAFPLDSLVADCGGILGLFLGFNFLMVWEWLLNGSIALLNRFNVN